MDEKNLLKRKRFRLKIILGVVFLLALLLLTAFLFQGDNVLILKSVFLEDLSNEQIQERLSEFGIRGYVVLAILSTLQVVFAFLPAEPIQVIAGISYGFLGGFLACTAGIIVGNTVIYLLYKFFGDKLNDYFDSHIHIRRENVCSSWQLTGVVFILYFLPAIPYGMICFFAAAMKMRYPRYITVTVLGAIPSVCIGVGLGHLAIKTSWILSAAIFAVLVILLAVLLKKKDLIFDKINQALEKGSAPYSSKTTVRPYSHHILTLLYIGSRIVFWFKGVRVRYYNRVGRVERPSIVLVNHGAFADFAYAGSLLRKESPNFIVARLYFCHKLLGSLLRRLGCFPKSMFATDLESAKNCLQVLKSGGVLAMMPEARLSTVGKFEDIQEGTYAFLKKSGVTVYSIKISGDYLAQPKWGKKMRRGALVEATLELLFTPEELARLSPEQIGARTEAALSYNEFEWLKNHPKVRYRSRTMAEGLENLLTLCPSCGEKYTMRTKRKSIRCEKCSRSLKVDQRYRFSEGAPFEHLADWYAWQEQKLREQILADPDYSLSAEVVLKHASRDGKACLRVSGKGICTLSRAGLLYQGTEDGEAVERLFPLESVYRLLFGAGESFEVYIGKEIYFFMPRDGRSAVDFYTASKILWDELFSSKLQRIVT